MTPETARRLRTWWATKPLADDSRYDDGITLEVLFEEEQQARFVVLGLGSEVKVRSPDALRQWVQGEAKLVSSQTSMRQREN